MGRRHTFGAMLGFLIIASPAAGSAEDQDARRLYDQVRRCYVANGHFRRVFRERGDAANERLFDGRAKDALKLAFHFGAQLHLGEATIQHDLEVTMSAETPTLVGSTDYLASVATACKRVGLM